MKSNFPPISQRLSGYAVLIAEDDPVSRALLEHTLTAEGAYHHCASNGVELLEQLRISGGSTWSIVLTDIHMPLMDGYQLTQEIRQRYPQLPVIGITANNDVSESQSCLDSGMSEYMSKPIGRSQLVDAILRIGIPNVASISAESAANSASSQTIAPPTGHSVVEARVTDASIIPWTALLSTFGNRLPFVIQLGKKALAAHTDMTSRLQAAIHQSHLQDIAFLAHAIKGMAGNFQATSLKEAAAALEAAARAEDEASIQSLSSTVLALESQFLEEISQFCTTQDMATNP